MPSSSWVWKTVLVLSVFTIFFLELSLLSISVKKKWNKSLFLVRRKYQHPASTRWLFQFRIFLFWLFWQGEFYHSSTLHQKGPCIDVGCEVVMSVFLRKFPTRPDWFGKSYQSLYIKYKFKIKKGSYVQGLTVEFKQRLSEEHSNTTLYVAYIQISVLEMTQAWNLRLSTQRWNPGTPLIWETSQLPYSC